LAQVAVAVEVKVKVKTTVDVVAEEKEDSGQAPVYIVFIDVVVARMTSQFIVQPLSFWHMRFVST